MSSSITRQIQPLILTIRKQNVIIDADLASLYGVSTKALNQAVKRNKDRFPDSFMFQLTKTEKSELVTNCDHLQNLKFSRTNPYAFTEHGALMAANVLNSAKAVEVSVQIVEVFVKMRRLALSVDEIARKVRSLERKFVEHDDHFKVVFEAIRQLMAPPPEKPKRRMGFRSDED